MAKFTLCILTSSVVILRSFHLNLRVQMHIDTVLAVLYRDSPQVEPLMYTVNSLNAQILKLFLTIEKSYCANTSMSFKSFSETHKFLGVYKWVNSWIDSQPYRHKTRLEIFDDKIISVMLYTWKLIFVCTSTQYGHFASPVCLRQFKIQGPVYVNYLRTIDFPLNGGTWHSLSERFLFI